MDPSFLSEATCHRVPLSEWRLNLDKDYADIEDMSSEAKRRSLHMTFGVTEEEEEGSGGLEVRGRETGGQTSAGTSIAPPSPLDLEWTEEEIDRWREGYMDMRKTSLCSLSPTSPLFPRPIRSCLTNSTSALYAVPRVRHDGDYVIPSPLQQNTLTQSSSENILTVNMYDVPRRYRANTGPNLPNRFRNHCYRGGNYQRPVRAAGLHTKVPSPLVGYQSPASVTRPRASSPGTSPDLQRKTLPSGDSYTIVDKNINDEGYSGAPPAGWRQTSYSNDSGYVEPRKLI